MSAAGFFAKMPFPVRMAFTILSVALWLYCCAHDAHGACMLLMGAMAAAPLFSTVAFMRYGSMRFMAVLWRRLFAFLVFFSFIGAGLLSAQYWPAIKLPVALFAPVLLLWLAFFFCQLRRWPHALAWLLWSAALSLSFLPIMRSQWLSLLAASTVGWLWGGALVVCWRDRLLLGRAFGFDARRVVSQRQLMGGVLLLSVLASAFSFERPYWLLMSFVFCFDTLVALPVSRFGRWLWPSALPGLLIAFLGSVLNLPAGLLGVVLAVCVFLYARSGGVLWLVVLLALLVEYIANLGVPANHLLWRHVAELLIGAGLAVLLRYWAMPSAA